MIFFNYGFLNPECIFWIMDWLIQNDFFNYECFAFFFILNWHYYSSTTVSINLGDYWKCQSENLTDFIIQNKKNVQFIEGQFCLCATLWGAERKMWWCRKKLSILWWVFLPAPHQFKKKFYPFFLMTSTLSFSKKNKFPKHTL